MRRARAIVRWAVGGALALALLVTLNLGAVVGWWMTPRGGFSQEPPPPAPDYALAASWSALPERTDSADRAPSGYAAVDPRRAAVDVFYVHPTSYVGPRWSAPADDRALNEATDRVATGIQASAFNGCCAVYAPRYRQANGTAFVRPSPDGERAIERAYDDVARAFDAFLARRGGARPFILAGHSQGSVLATRLLERRISRTPLRERLVAAYLPGGNVTLEGLRARAPDLAPCGAPDDLRCVVAWNARGPGFRPTAFEIRRPAGETLLCTNPLTWRVDERPAARAINGGAVFLEHADRAPRPGFADARCAGGTLVVSAIGRAPRDLPSRILDRVLGAGNYHPIEYQMFFMNIRENAMARAAAAAR